jgi:hypothetical protein
LSNDYGQPCVIRSGESVTILQEGYRLPDGTTVTSIENCDFETDSSVVLEQPADPTPAVLSEPPTAVDLPKAAAPPVPRIIPIHVPRSYTPSVDELPDNPTNTQATAVVVEQAVEQAVGQGPAQHGSGIPMPVHDSGIPMSVIVATVAATVAGVAAMSGAKGKKGKGTRQQKRTPDQNRREQEERQKECTAKSDRVDQHIQQIANMADNSKTAKLEIREPEGLYGEIELVSQEVSVLSRVVRRRQKRTSR